MALTYSPNMNLPIPTVGQEPGPEYATDINNSLTLVDAHDHTPGSGVPITPAALDINTDLTFAQNAATNVSKIGFYPQSSTPSGANALYEKSVDLYYIDGNGNDIRITQSGGVAGTPGSIAGLVAPASATYIPGSSAFVWQSDINTAANMDMGSLILRNLSPNSTFALTLEPPAALSTNYTLTLPQLPSVDSFMQISPAGLMTNTIPIALGIDTANIAAGAITNVKMATNSVDTAQIVNGAVTPAKLSVLQKLTVVDVTTTFVVPTGITSIIVKGIGGGGGGGGGGLSGSSQNTSGGAGGASGQMGTVTMTVTPGETLTASLGSGGSGGAFAGAPGNGSAGGTGGTTTLTAGTSGWVLRFAGGNGGAGGIGNNALGTATGGAAAFRGGTSSSSGGSSVSGLFGSPSAGEDSVYAAGGAAGANGPSGTGGGGGAAGFAAGGAGSAGNLSTGSAGSLGSGGGGSGGSTGAGGGAGGAGGAGRVYVMYVNNA